MKIILSILKLVAVLFIVVLNLFVNGAVGCLENERQALLQLKASLVLDDTSLLTTWDSKSDGCCAWEGIRCNNQTGHVEMFHLSHPLFGFFPGEINASLMELRHLKYLNISGNRFSNSIFSELFGSLTNLRFLDLQDSFSGGRIPNDLGRLSNLQYLDLSQNDLEGTIPHQLGNLSHLHYLDLSANDFVGTIPHQLGSLSKLQELNLGYNFRLKFDDKNNHVGGQWLSNLTLLTHLDLSGISNLNSSHVWLQMIAKLPKIQELKLSFCGISDLYLHSLSHSRLNFSTSLAILDLSYNAFSSSKIFEWVFNATSNLIELDLSYNNFNGTISYDFGNIKSPLKLLDLSENELQGGVPESIRHICTLQSLHLDRSNLNEDISTILHKLSGCARYSLQYLSLHDNKITGALPNFSIFSSLVTIDLSFNMLSGKIPDGIPKSLVSLGFGSNSLEGGIPKSFGNLCSLRSLELSSNRLSEDLSVILHNLSFGCTKDSLQELYLDINQMSGTLPDMSMFSSLRTLSLSSGLLNGRILKNSTFPFHLVSLYLDSNNFEGVITDSHFGNMSMLKDLYLNDNSLSLVFPENWVPAFQLNTIGLRSCMLGPRFPKWLQSQNLLQQIDISNAKITDAVPVWFWTQTKYLKFMNISYNNLFGTIPNLPIRFSEGCEVILDSNQFEGSIPLFLQSAAFLRLSENKFSDTRLLLCSNNTIDRLHLLDISKNKLSKQLHNCWSHLKSLVFLDLSDNTLSGEVPSSMGSLHALTVLILRNNSFTGKLPVTLKKCTRLIMLDVGDNSFSGPIPYWLGQELEMLSLRRNQFNGSIPQSLCYLTNIQLLDLSENSLSGGVFKCLMNFSAMSQNDSSTRAILLGLPYSYGNGFTSGYISYDLIAVLMWKGTERSFKNNKLILNSIDLSSNQLTGDIPQEIGNLIRLVSLNLSRNNLSGEITSKIGRLTSLDSLDLSQNHFFGPIPQSLTQIDRLSTLNLSHNNLSGRIPISTQLQSFDASSYEGNVDLCGKPLDRKCPGDEEVAHPKPEPHEESSPEDKKPIYLSVALGFITGYGALWGSLFLIKTWRHKYVLFLNNIVDTMYVFMMLKGIKFQRWLRSLQEKFV
ncbi:receptor-like protein EIX1 isoform X1 [Vicia villosa]|uniref:receptor-like protein EIX1 isoform X1 n=1 Tax=Vicia villosa TaxID=3911 RepID=UPI00273B9FED|nr:receptor-like protein EIX1 isoform X1 [Vicia villosa]